MTNRKDTENPNLARLKETLSTYLIKKGKESRGIIFVRTRALTEALVSWLNTCSDSELRNLNATVFTGTAASVDEGGMCCHSLTILIPIVVTVGSSQYKKRLTKHISQLRMGNCRFVSDLFLIFCIWTAPLLRCIAVSYDAWTHL